MFVSYQNVFLSRQIFDYRGQKTRAVETPTFDPSSGNPFAERPSTARQNEANRQALEAAITELDKAVNAPEGIETHIWERMCILRRQKIEGEQLVSMHLSVLVPTVHIYKA